MNELTEFQASLLARALLDTASGGSLFGMKVDLYQTNIDIQPTTPLATFTAAVATYAGYAQKTVTWDLPTIAADGTVEVVGVVTAFRPTGSSVSNTIWGIYCQPTGGGALYFAGQFDTAPIAMAATTDQIIITIRYRPADQTIVDVVN